MGPTKRARFSSRWLMICLGSVLWLIPLPTLAEPLENSGIQAWFPLNDGSGNVVENHADFSVCRDVADSAAANFEIDGQLESVKELRPEWVTDKDGNKLLQFKREHRGYVRLADQSPQCKNALDPFDQITSEAPFVVSAWIKPERKLTCNDLNRRFSLVSKWVAIAGQCSYWLYLVARDKNRGECHDSDMEYRIAARFNDSGDSFNCDQFCALRPRSSTQFAGSSHSAVPFARSIIPAASASSETAVGGSIADGVWSHVALVVDSSSNQSKANILVNGKSALTTTEQNQCHVTNEALPDKLVIQNSDSDVLIGGRENLDDKSIQGFTGNIKQVKFGTHAVAALANVDVNRFTAYLQFDDNGTESIDNDANYHACFLPKTGSGNNAREIDAIIDGDVGLPRFVNDADKGSVLAFERSDKSYAALDDQQSSCREAKDSFDLSNEVPSFVFLRFKADPPTCESIAEKPRMFLIDKWDSSVENGCAYQAFLNTYDSNAGDCVDSDVRHQLVLRLGRDGGGCSDYCGIRNRIDIRGGEWHELAIYYDPRPAQARVQIFNNGQPTLEADETWDCVGDNGSVPNHIPNSPAALKIGSRYNPIHGHVQGFTGQIDEFVFATLEPRVFDESEASSLPTEQPEEAATSRNLKKGGGCAVLAVTQSSDIEVLLLLILTTLVLLGRRRSLYKV